MDVNGLWVSGNRGANITWSMSKIDFEDAPTLRTWEVKRQEELLFTEDADRSEWGRLLFTGPSVR